jgi:hypothetical protein
MGRLYDQQVSRRPHSPNAGLRAGKPFCLERRIARLQDQRTPTDVHASSAAPANPPPSRLRTKAPLLLCSLVLRYLLRQCFFAPFQGTFTMFSLI